MSEIVLDFDFFLSHYNYWMFVILMMTGLYVTVSRGNLIKKIVGLNLFQTSVFLLYISMGKIIGGTAPILVDDPETVYSNPLPQVLILTAIVVGIATTALALALVIRIRETYGTIEEDDILALEHEMEFGDAMPPPGRGTR
tara:strand:- start:9556 stop:9978 length:423 start_codon:yes stop_codon:yes gene_type:complete